MILLLKENSRIPRSRKANVFPFLISITFTVIFVSASSNAIHKGFHVHAIGLLILAVCTCLFGLLILDIPKIFLPRWISIVFVIFLATASVIAFYQSHRLSLSTNSSISASRLKYECSSHLDDTASSFSEPSKVPIMRRYCTENWSQILDFAGLTLAGTAIFLLIRMVLYSRNH